LPPAFTVLAAPSGRPYGLAHGRGYLGGREHGAGIGRRVRFREARDCKAYGDNDLDERESELVDTHGNSFDTYLLLCYSATACVDVIR
jgi:hypothetical protein